MLRLCLLFPYLSTFFLNRYFVYLYPAQNISLFHIIGNKFRLLYVSFHAFCCLLGLVPCLLFSIKTFRSVTAYGGFLCFFMSSFSPLSTFFTNRYLVNYFHTHNIPFCYTIGRNIRALYISFFSCLFTSLTDWYRVYHFYSHIISFCYTIRRKCRILHVYFYACLHFLRTCTLSSFFHSENVLFLNSICMNLKFLHVKLFQAYLLFGSLSTFFMLIRFPLVHYWQELQGSSNCFFFSRLFASFTDLFLAYLFHSEKTSFCHSICKNFMVRLCLLFPNLSTFFSQIDTLSAFLHGQNI